MPDVSAPEDPKWYCLRSHPKHEHIAAAHLRQVEGIEVFCPRVKLQRSTRRGLVWFTEALFPNYLFARFDLTRFHRLVKHGHGVAGIVHFGTKYAEVPASAVEQLRGFMEGAELKTVSFALAEGDAVEIVEGPLRGQTGVVTQLLPARERVKVLLEFLGGTKEIDLGLTAVFKDVSLASELCR